MPLPTDDPLDPYLVDAVKKFEGFTAIPGWDYKQYSSGYGTKTNDPNERIDKVTAEKRLNSELTSARKYVDSLGVSLTPGQRNALTSLTFNAGPGWINSGLGQAVKKGDWDTASKLFLSYNKAGGEVSPGLVSRRKAELGWTNNYLTLPNDQASGVTPASQAIANNINARQSQQNAQQFKQAMNLFNKPIPEYDYMLPVKAQQQFKLVPIAGNPFAEI